jgi:hypothetical protein
MKRYGCTDCGETWSKKADVPAACRPYVVTIRRNDRNVGGYESTCDPGEISWCAS